MVSDSEYKRLNFLSENELIAFLAKYQDNDFLVTLNKQQLLFLAIRYTELQFYTAEYNTKKAEYEKLREIAERGEVFYHILPGKQKAMLNDALRDMNSADFMVGSIENTIKNTLISYRTASVESS